MPCVKMMRLYGDKHRDPSRIGCWHAWQMCLPTICSPNGTLIWLLCLSLMLATENMQVVLRVQSHKGGISRDVALRRERISSNPVSSQLCRNPVAGIHIGPASQ